MSLLLTHIRRLTHRPAILLSAGLLAILPLTPFGDGTAEAALNNSGFESGNLFPWTVGAAPEGVFIVDQDIINPVEDIVQTPFEGAFMARLGIAQPTATPTQPIGPNELIQDFTISGLSIRFAYNIWTYDTTGFDNFSVELRLVLPNEIIYSHSEQSWGFPSDSSRKTTGWRVLDIPVSTLDRGALARLTIRSGGTRDNQLPFWIYLDSAEGATPPPLVDTTALKVGDQNPNIDPASGSVYITPRPTSPPIHIEAPVLCPDGSTPDPVTAVLATSPPLHVPLLPSNDNLWSGDIPVPLAAAPGTSWPLAFLLLCDGVTVPAPVGSVTVIEPSGLITDAATGLPVVGATITLQQQQDGVWRTTNPFATVLGSSSVSPPINPQLAANDGSFGWDVASGTYRVIVTATGYLGQASASSLATSPLSGLNVALTPLSATIAWDVDCDVDVDAVDSLKLLQHIVGLHVNQAEGCPPIGSPGILPFGDVDCDADIDAVDSLKLLQHIAGLLLILPAGCPKI